MKIIILHSELCENAGPDEMDVMVQVHAVASSVRSLGHIPIPLSFSLDVSRVIRAIESISPDLIFNLVESVKGYGSLIHLAPSLFDALKIPYTGCRTEAVFLTSNKLLSKRFLHQSNIPTPFWLPSDNGTEEKAIPAGDYIIKSVWEHASIGLDDESVVRPLDGKDLFSRMESQKGQLGGAAFAELFIDGREFNLSLMSRKHRPEVLPIAEIRFDDFPENKKKIVGYRAKWIDGAFEYHHTPRCFDFEPNDAVLLDRLRFLAIECWNLFQLRGYGRVDFRVDNSGQPWVLEINTNPCLSPDSGFLASTEKAGMTYDQVIERIIQEI